MENPFTYKPKNPFTSNHMKTRKQAIKENFNGFILMIVFVGSIFLIGFLAQLIFGN